MGENGAFVGVHCGYLRLYLVIFGKKGANIGQIFYLCTDTNTNTWQI